MTPAEITLFRSANVEPSRRAFRSAAGNGRHPWPAWTALAARAMYAAALARYVEFLTAHRYAVPHDG